MELRMHSAHKPHPGADAPILYFGRLSREKGVADLIAAMSSLPDIPLIIAGLGPQREDLERLVASLKLKNISFAGHVSGAALTKLISSSQFTVFPSRAYETLGKSILESFAHGRAVVASDLGSRRELVEDGATGLLYQADNVEPLAAAIRRLSNQPELARAMGEAARALVREKHSVEQHLGALTEIYAQLAATKTRGKLAVCPETSSQPLKIAYIGGRGLVGKYSGIETYYEETGKRLAARGHEVTVYCRWYFTPEPGSRDATRIVRLPTVRSKHLETLVHTALSTLHACFSRCDIVHYHALGPALFSFVPRIFGKKTVVTVQGLDWQRKKWSWLARVVLGTGEWSAARFPDRTVVVSRTLQKYFQSKYRTEISYVPNGAQIRTRCGSNQLEQFGLASQKYALFLGRLSPGKKLRFIN
jgi:glycosyltransferase involved in cell wall biosynthesis